MHTQIYQLSSLQKFGPRGFGLDHVTANAVTEEHHSSDFGVHIDLRAAALQDLLAAPYVDSTFWNHFWNAKLAVMGTRGIKSYTAQKLHSGRWKLRIYQKSTEKK